MTDALSFWEKLEAAGSPGPWHVVSGKLRPQFAARITAIHDAEDRPVVSWGGFDDSNRPRAEHDANAQAIVIARKMFGEAIAALESSCPNHGYPFSDGWPDDHMVPYAPGHLPCTLSSDANAFLQRLAAMLEEKPHG